MFIVFSNNNSLMTYQKVENNSGKPFCDKNYHLIAPSWKHDNNVMAIKNLCRSIILNEAQSKTICLKQYFDMYASLNKICSCDYNNVTCTNVHHSKKYIQPYRDECIQTTIYFV